MLPPWLREKVDRAAEHAHLSRSAFLAFIIEEAMADHEFVVDKMKERFVSNMREVFPLAKKPSKKEIDEIKRGSI